MGLLVLIAVVVLFVIFWQVIKKIPPSVEGIARAKAEIIAEIEETNKKLKDAVEKGADPKTVVIFESLETDSVLKNSSLYPMVMEICMELYKRGYQCGSDRLVNDPYNSHGAKIHIYPDPLFPNGIEYKKESEIDPKEVEKWKRGNDSFYYCECGYAPTKLGTIEFWDMLTPSYLMHLNSNYEEEHRSNTHFGFTYYTIQRLPNLIIRSNVSPPEKIPEWLMICANVLRTYSPPVTDPEWMRKYPEAKRYVNVMFR